MRNKQSFWGFWGWMGSAALSAGGLVACGDNGHEQVAGGQSGTDADGAYSCQLKGASSRPVGLDELVCGRCQVQEAVARIARPLTFSCSQFGAVLTLDFTPGDSAQELTGKLYSDTDRDAPPTACCAYAVDTEISGKLSDGSFTLTGTRLLGDHLCSTLAFEATVTRADGRKEPVRLTLLEGGELHVASLVPLENQPMIETEVCTGGVANGAAGTP